MKKIRIILFFVTLFLGTFNILNAQNNNNKNSKEEEELDSDLVEKLREFDDNTFRDAQPYKIKDSTIITQHLIGLKYGYGINKVDYSITNDHTQMESLLNLGLYYTYYHTLWGTMPFFGMQLGFELGEIGQTYVEGKDETRVENELRFRSYTMPLTTQFRYDVGMVRIMLGVGGYFSYISSSLNDLSIPENLNRYGGGIIGNLGFALKFDPIEVHLEGGYRYSLSYLYDPTSFSDRYWVYTYPNQIQISLGLFYRFGNKENKIKKERKEK